MIAATAALGSGPVPFWQVCLLGAGLCAAVLLLGLLAIVMGWIASRWLRRRYDHPAGEQYIVALSLTGKDVLIFDSALWRIRPIGRISVAAEYRPLRNEHPYAAQVRGTIVGGLRPCPHPLLGGPPELRRQVTRR